MKRLIGKNTAGLEFQARVWVLISAAHTLNSHAIVSKIICVITIPRSVDHPLIHGWFLKRDYSAAIRLIN